jgi:hypothetical protein
MKNGKISTKGFKGLILNLVDFLVMSTPVINVYISETSYFLLVLFRVL